MMTVDLAAIGGGGGGGGIGGIGGSGGGGGGGGEDEAGDRAGMVESARDGVRVVVFAMFGKAKAGLAKAVLEVLEGWGGSEERSVRDVAARHGMSERWLRVNVERARKRMGEVVERMGGGGGGAEGPGTRDQGPGKTGR